MNNIVNTNDIDIDYTLIYKDRDLILDDINLSEDDRFITEAIIESLESEVANKVKEGFTVSIPFIGSIDRQWYREAIKSKYNEFREFKETHTKEEYKEYFKEETDKIKRNHSEEEDKLKRFKKFKSKLLPRYIQLSATKGSVYANCWLVTLNKLEIVEFDPEIEEVYERFRS